MMEEKESTKFCELCTFFRNLVGRKG